MIASAGYFRYAAGMRSDLATDIAANLPVAAPR